MDPNYSGQGSSSMPYGPQGEVCASCGSTEFELSDAVGEVVCSSCATVSSSNQLLVNTALDETDVWFFEGKRAVNAGNGGGTRRLGGLKSSAEDERAVAQEKRVDAAKALITNLARVFDVPSLVGRAIAYYERSEAKRRILRDRVYYTAAAALAIVMRDQKRPDSLRDVAHAADLSLLRLSRVYVSLQQQLDIGVTEIEPVVYIERHITHLASIVKDQSNAVTKVSAWIKNGRFAKDPGTLDVLKSLDFKDVRTLAISLSSFLASSHVYHGRHAVTVSAAIVIIAIEGSTAYRSPSARDLADEMCKVYAASGWTAMERYREGQKVLLDWSEQFDDYDLSVREVSVSKAGRHTRNVDKRLEVSRLVRRVLDEEDSLRAKRQQLGLELSSNLTFQKLSELPKVEKSGVESWSRSAAVGDDVEDIGGTWDELYDDEEDSELEDDPDADPLSSGTPPSPPPLNTSSLPAQASSSSIPRPPPVSTQSTLSNSVPSQLSASQAPSPSNSTSIASHQLAHLQPTQNTSLASSRNSTSIASHSDYTNDNFHDSTQNDITTSHAPFSSLPNSQRQSPEFAETEDQLFDNVLSALGPAEQSADSLSLTLLSRAAGASDDASIVSSSANPAFSNTSSSAPPQPSPLNPANTSRSTRSVSPAPSATGTISTLYMDPTVSKRQLRADAWTASSARLQKSSQSRDLMSTMSTLLDDANSVHSTISEPPAKFVHRGVFGGMRPTEYMRHRPSDLMKTNPYRHLSTATIASVRKSGQADTELARLILAGHDIHTLPAHLAPHSTLGVLAALRSGGADAVEDEELFIDGELEGYMRPDQEVEFVSKMWEDEGKWEGEEERERRRVVEEAKKAKKRAREEDAAALEDGGPLQGRGVGKGRRGRSAAKTKATEEMKERLAALAGSGDEASGNELEDYEDGPSRSKRSRTSHDELEEESAVGGEADPLIGQIDPELLRMEREMDALRGVGQDAKGSEDEYED